MHFISSLTDLYSAAIRFEREFADGFDEPVPSASSGEQATEEATDESPCASPIPELRAPVVSPRPSVQPQIETSPPHVNFDIFIACGRCH